MKSKRASDLSLKIARLGAGLAARPRPVQSDIVIQKQSLQEKPRVRNLAVRLNVGDMVLLDDRETWARQNGLKVGWGTLLKAGLRSLHKNDQGLHLLRQMVEADGRRRVE